MTRGPKEKTNLHHLQDDDNCSCHVKKIQGNHCGNENDQVKVIAKRRKPSTIMPSRFITSPNIIMVVLLTIQECQCYSSPPPYIFSSSHVSSPSSLPFSSALSSSPNMYPPLFASSSSPSSSASSSPSTFSPIAFHSTASMFQNLLSNTINSKVTRHACIEGLPTFELVTGYSWGGRTSGDVLKTLTDVMNIGDCLTQCLRIKECKSVNFETGLCILLSTAANYTAPTAPGETPMEKASLTPGHQGLKVSQYPVFTIYAEKICLEGYRSRVACSGRSWSFERVIGFKLKDNLVRKSKIATTRIACMESCLNETSFECRSVTFNRETGTCNFFDLDRQAISSGQVLKRGLLMKKKRYGERSSSPNEKSSFNEGDLKEATASTLNPNEWHFDQNFIPSDPDAVDYFESNCVRDPKQCEFAPIKNLILKTVDSVHENVRTIDGCKEKCLSAPYRCFSFDFGADSDPKVGGICRTSHINTGSVLTIDNPFAEMPGAVTYQLVSCMNITVECLAHTMIAKIRTNRVFNGKVYSRSKPNSCVNDIKWSMDFSISLPYNDVMCDVMAEPSNGNLFRSELVVQHHDRIVTQSDFGVSVLCRFDLKNRTITNGPLVIDGSTAYSAEGSAGLIEASSIQWPNVTMRIADIEGKPVTSARVGDTLNLLFDIVDTNSPYEIFVRDLVAVDGIDSSEIVLIDSAGCPTEMAIMTSVSKFSKTSKRLRTTFEAFKFPASDMVQFRALITPCLSSCKPVQCNLLNTETGVNQEFISYGRRRKRSMSSPPTTPEPLPKPEVVVMGAIKIRDNIDFRKENNRGGKRKGDSGVHAAHFNNYPDSWFSSNPDDDEFDGDDIDEEQGQCTDLISLTVAGMVFLFGQLTLLAAWYYMFQKVQMYRAKMSSLGVIGSPLPTTYRSPVTPASSLIDSPLKKECNISHSLVGENHSSKSFPSKFLFPRVSSPVNRTSGHHGQSITNNLLDDCVSSTPNNHRSNRQNYHHHRCLGSNTSSPTSSCHNNSNFFMLSPPTTKLSPPSSPKTHQLETSDI